MGIRSMLPMTGSGGNRSEDGDLVVKYNSDIRITEIRSQNYSLVDGEKTIASKYALSNAHKLLLSPVYVENIKEGECIVYRTNDMSLDKQYVVFWEGAHYILQKTKDGVQMYEVGIEK